MRRRLPTFIPILLIAVLAQFLAPVGAFRAVAGMLSDPLAFASICSGTASPDNGQHAPSGQDHADCCAVCAAAHSVSFSVHAPTPELIEPLRDISRFVWHFGIDASSMVRWRSPAQARGPPASA